MAYVWVEEPEEGADVRDVVAREDYDQIVTERDEAVVARDVLEAKMEAILRAIDRYRASVTSLAELADQRLQLLRQMA